MNVRQRGVGIAAVATVATLASAGTDVLVSVAVAGASLGFLALYEALSERVRALRQDRKRDAIDKAVEGVVPLEETTLDAQEKVVEKVETDSPEVGNVDPKEIRRRMRQHLISRKAAMSAELDKALLGVLPASPRGAKRMINHAHLLLDIGLERRIFAPGSRLRPKQLATWVCITERWPAIALAIMDNPKLMEHLERMARQANQGGRREGPAATLARAGIIAPDAGLLAYLRTADPVAAVVDTLVSFSPLRSPDGHRSDAAETEQEYPPARK